MPKPFITRNRGFNALVLADWAIVCLDGTGWFTTICMIASISYVVWDVCYPE